MGEAFREKNMSWIRCDRRHGYWQKPMKSHDFSVWLHDFKFMSDGIADHQCRAFHTHPHLGLLFLLPSWHKYLVCRTMERTAKQQHPFSPFPLKKSIWGVLGVEPGPDPAEKNYFSSPFSYSDQAETCFFITGRGWVQLPLSAVSVLTYS